MEKELEEKYEKGAIENLIHSKLSRILSSLGIVGDDGDINRRTKEAYYADSVEDNPSKVSNEKSPITKEDPYAQTLT